LAAEKPGVSHSSDQQQARRSTLADVARHAGVTTMTVSRFLRTPEQVAPMTAQRVQEALERTGYVANKQAGILATGASSMVAAIIPNIAHSIFSETIQGLSDTLEAQGFELLLASSGYSLEREQKQIRALLGWNPFALVVTGRHHTPDSIRLLLAAQGAGTPVVEMWDQTSSRPEFAHIGFDHTAAGALMARHLMAKGYRRLVYVDSGVAEDFRAHERGVGFVQAAAAQHGVEARVVRAGIGEPIAAGRALLRKLIESISSTGNRSKNKPYQEQASHAVAFANDHLAVGAWLQAQDLRIAVPERIALLGFGDFPLAGQISGGISTVAAPRYAIGQAVGQWIAQQKKNPPWVKRTSASSTSTSAEDPEAARLLEPVLVQRRST
jgi:LacI family gluconate utilization system Gnt-I transcriptional repressor